MHRQLTTIGEPFFLLRDFPRTKMPDFEYGAGEVVVRRLRGKKCRTYQAFMDEIGAAFQFFGGFGENWPAVAELLRWMDEWLPSKGYVVLMEDAELLFKDAAVEWGAFGRVIETVGQYWAVPIVDNGRFNRPALPFHVVLEGERDTIIRALGRAQIRWGLLERTH